MSWQWGVFWRAWEENRKTLQFLDKCWTVLDPVAMPNPATVILASRHFQLKRAYHMLSGADCKFLEDLRSTSLSPLACTTPWSCVHLTFWSIHLEAINGSLSQISLGHLLAPRSWFFPFRGLSKPSVVCIDFLFCFWNSGVFIHKVALPLGAVCPEANRCSHPHLPSRWIKSSQRLQLAGKSSFVLVWSVTEP